MSRRSLPVLFVIVTLMMLSRYSISLAETELEHSHLPEEHSHTLEPHTHKKRPHIHNELLQIKKWLAEIERDTERRPLFKQTETAEDIFPLQSTRKTRLNGGLTAMIQGILNNEVKYGGNRADGSLSVDLILTSEIRSGGLLIIRGDFMRGEGLTHLPPLFSGGINADIEDFSTGTPDTFHLIEALYEQTWQNERFRLSIGQIDLTSYFDLNQFANSETFQFISPVFGNNIAISWGGDANGYGPGVVLHAHPVKAFQINLGLFEGDGNYKNVFDQGFWIVELEYVFYSGERKGHYRLNYWSNETNQSGILNSGSVLTRNRGMGISFDQTLSEELGIWGRFGIQDGAISEYDQHASTGLQVTALPGRPEDVLGIAIGKTWISDEYQMATGLSASEVSGEIYYNISVGDGFYLTPDFQYISNPGGDGVIGSMTIYGLRAQLSF